MDIFDKCSEFTYAKEFIASGYYPYFIPMEGNEAVKPFLKVAVSL